MTPRESVQAGLDALAVRLDPIIATRLKGALGTLPWTAVLSELDKAKGFAPKIYETTDLQCQLRMLTQKLGGIGFPFDDQNRTASVIGGELRIVRNRWAHNAQFSALDAWRTNDYAARLLENLGDETGAEAAAERRNALLPAVWKESGLPLPTACPTSLPETVAMPTASGPLLPNAEPAQATQSVPSDSEDELVSPDPSVLVRADAAETPTIGSGREQFEPWQVVLVGDVTVLDDLPKKVAKEQVRAVAIEIAEFEGPLHIDRLTQLVAESFGVQRLHSPRARKIVSQIKATGLSIDADKIVWPSDLDPATWAEFRPNSSDVDRAFTEISPVEIANAAEFIRRQPDGSDLSTAELERRVLQTFGRKRRMKGFVQHLERALSKAE